MRIPRLAVCLLGVGCCGAAGCSQTWWLRPNGPTDGKPTVSINGKPVRTATGEPGTGSAPAEEIEDLAPPSAGSRISGRVFDEEGRAVPNARVRLGLGGSAGGRVNFATTDRSGAFTLHGLRPGQSYTLIAEYQGEDGMMTGRIQTRSPGTGVRIALGARDPDPESEPRGAKILPARVRSTLFPDDGEDGFPAAARPRVPAAEDQDVREAPAEEATSVSPRTTRPTSARLAATTPSAPSRAGWSVRQRPSSTPVARSRAAADADDARDGPPSPEAPGGADDDDGENPLPPALEPEDSGPSRSTGRDSLSYAPPPRQIPEDAFPRSSGVSPASYSRDGSRPAGSIDAPARRSSNLRRGTRGALPAATRPSDESRAIDDSDAGDSSDDSPPRPRSTRRPTWRDVSISPSDVPVDEALRRSSDEEGRDGQGAVMLAGGPTSRGAVAEATDTAVARETAEAGDTADVTDAKPRRIRTIAGSPTTTKPPSSSSSHPSAARPAGSICRLDPSHRRIVELQLPGLDGSMVSLRDTDADLVLLDFWGSWCRECRKSIEHLRELQEQLGGKKLQVIGIACEKAATFEGRRDAAVAAARKLGISYPVLVTTMDGTCPVQRSLQVQFYPTMILLDRDGNILQFEQGATDATLGRIDRPIAKALRDGDGRDGD
jgi:thiol-disulfide isomerase/thioredoxin